MYLDLNIYLEIVENVVANAVRFANRKLVQSYTVTRISYM